MPSTDPTPFEIITNVASILTPLLILFLSGIGWIVGHRIKKQTEQEKQQFEIRRENEQYWRELEDKLRPERIEIYNNILLPFMIALAKEIEFPDDKRYRNKSKEEVAKSVMLSLDYRRTSYQLVLMGSDNVVRAFNALMQHFYNQSASIPQLDNTKKLLNLLGDLLLEIRRSVGNEKTNIDNLEMLEWLITDIGKYR